MDNKDIFANNLKRYMSLRDKSRRDISEALGISYYTVTDWVKGKKYPRMNRVEELAAYFGVLKSDLIEEKTEEQREIQQKNSTLADITVRMLANDDLLSLVNDITQLDEVQLASVRQIVSAFLSTKS